MTDDARCSAARLRESLVFSLVPLSHDREEADAILREFDLSVRRAEFIDYTLTMYGERMPSQWKAHARAVLSDA